MKRLSKTDLKQIQGAAAPPMGGRCPEGYCQYYSQHGACLPIDPDKCNHFPVPPPQF